MPKPKGSKSVKKHKIFSGSMQEAISRALAVDDVRQLSKSDLKLLRERISINRSVIKRMNPDHPLAQAKLINLTPAATLKLFLSSESDVIKQKHIMQDLSEIVSDKKYNNLSDNTITETLSNIQDAISEEYENIMEDVQVSDHEDWDIENKLEELTIEDKWTILRRLATQVFRLNIDRAYASETLREIEDEIESHPHYTISDITDKWLQEHAEQIEADKNWNSEMRGFREPESRENQALYQNRGFHGVDKAMRKQERIERLSRTLTDLGAYEPAWEAPTPLDPTSIANPQVREGWEWFNKYDGA